MNRLFLLRSWLRPTLGVVFLAALTLVSWSCASPKGGSTPAPVGGSKAETPIVRASKPGPEDERAKAYAHYATAIIYELDRQPDKALEEYEVAVKLDPANEPLVLELARRLLLKKRYDRALAILDRGASQPDASADLYAWKGLVLAQAGKLDLAIAAHKIALKKDPRLLLSHQNLAQLYYQANQKKELLKTLMDAAKQAGAGNDAAYLVDVAVLLVEFRPLLGKPGEVLKPRIQEILAAAAAAKPAQPLILEKMAECYKTIGQADQATALYKEIIAQHPEVPELRVKLAEAYLNSNDTTNAMRQLETLIRDNPVDVRAYYLLGNLALETRDYKKAVEYFSRVRLLNEDFEPAYYDMARAYLADAQPKEALATLEKVKNQTRNFRWEFFSALAHLNLKAYARAIEHLNNAEVIATATDTNQLTHFFYSQLGAAYERVQNYDQAERYFDKCLKLGPNDAEAMNYLGYMWAERGVKLDQAKVLIEKALKQEPDNAAFLDSMGWVLYQLDQPEVALTYLLKAVQNSKEPDATVYDHLGDTYQKLKQLDKAREAWRKSLELEPKEPDATVYDHRGDTYQKLQQLDKAREAWRKSLELEPKEAVQKKLDAR